MQFVLKNLLRKGKVLVKIDTFAKNCRVYGILELSISAVLGSGYMTHI